MSSRLSFRSRPLDPNSQLVILRSLDDIEEGGLVTREVSHAHKALDKENEEVLTVKTTAGSEIPVPEVRTVASYDTDYRPIFRQPMHYIRSLSSQSSDFVQYDLDNEDEDWLKSYNDGQNRLPPEKFELMLWRLETACEEATERALAERLSMYADKGGVLSHAEKVQAAASTSTLSREMAYEAMREASTRLAVLQAVYEYWVAKRKRWGKPIMRMLQVPPASSDTDPFHVFRTREKVNRPQTRRRRENDIAAFDKMTALRQNLEAARQLLEVTLKREKKKRDLVQCETDAQALHVKLRHEPRQLHEQIEAEAYNALSTRKREYDDPQLLERTATDAANGGGAGGAPVLEIQRRPDGSVAIAKASPDAVAAAQAAHRHKRQKHHHRHHRDERSAASARSSGPAPPYRPPPEAPKVEMLFALPLDVAALPSFGFPPRLNGGACRARVGRGGRIVLDRCNPITRSPHVAIPAEHLATG
mmetsp:Transcript_12554/g.41388  ORF Transcript_12554/g.41388 Transcript_12554/m.41388 type:complete len:475 (+) Transcript_12554:175-1599(+)